MWWAGFGGLVAGVLEFDFAVVFPSKPILQVVEPKIGALRESEAELRVATRERQAAEAELAVVQVGDSLCGRSLCFSRAEQSSPKDGKENVYTCS
jgi:hypothetical protein